MSLSLIMIIKDSNQSKYLRFPLLVAALSLGFTACNGDSGASPQQVRKAIQSQLPQLVESSVDALNSYQGNKVIEALDDALDILSMAPNKEEPYEDLSPEEEDQEEAFLDADGKEISKFLSEKVFNEENHEGEGIYKIPASILCPADEESATGLDAHCNALVNTLEPRVFVETATDGLDFEFLLGPDKIAPLSLELRSDSISLSADLSEAKDAAQLVAIAIEEDFAIPTTMQGKISLSLQTFSEKDVEVKLSIDEAIEFEGELPDVGPVKFSSAIAAPFITTRVKDLDKSIQFALNLGRTQLSVPGKTFFEEVSSESTFALYLQGLSSSMQVNDSIEDALIITDIGFGNGQSTVTLDDAVLLALDLNKDSGRKFDLHMNLQENKHPEFRFVDSFKLEFFGDLSPLVAAGEEDIPSFLLGETFTIEVQDGLQPMEGTSEDGIKALGAGFGMSSTANNGNFVVADGECLLSSPVEDGEHEFLGQFQVGACPL